jgi:hypothetical protein
MSYRPVTDDDHSWAVEGDAEQRLRGPCGPLIATVNNAVAWIQDQSGIQKAAMVLAIVTFLGLVNTFIEDEHMSVLVPGDGTCAKKARFLPSDRQLTSSNCHLIRSCIPGPTGRDFSPLSVDQPVRPCLSSRRVVGEVCTPI